jgi:hypothetical protein
MMTGLKMREGMSRRAASVLPAVEQEPGDQPRRPRRTRWFWLPLLLLAGYLLVAHGCHGDEDNELLLRMINEATQKQ